MSTGAFYAKMVDPIAPWLPSVFSQQHNMHVPVSDIAGSCQPIFYLNHHRKRVKIEFVATCCVSMPFSRKTMWSRESPWMHLPNLSKLQARFILCKLPTFCSLYTLSWRHLPLKPCPNWTHKVFTRARLLI